MVNKVILLGRVGKDPEVRNLENGATVANLTLATSEKYKDKQTGESKEVTEWHRLVLWRGLAEIAAKYVHKGDLLYVTGKIKARSWDSDDGKKHYITEIFVDELKMLGSPKGKKSDTSNEPIASDHDSPGAASDDLLF